MKIELLCKLFVILSINVRGMEGVKGGPKMGNLMSKEQILNLIDSSIRQMLDPTCKAEDDKPALNRYVALVNSLSFCIQKGDISKPELVSCLNNVLKSGNMDPPVEFIHCVGEYIMCTARSCFAALKRKEGEEEMAKCLVECIPRGVLCIARSNPVPERHSGL